MSDAPILSLCHRCPFHAGGACTRSGRKIQAHKKALFCPHPEGPRFGASTPPPDWESVPHANVVQPAPLRGLGDVVARITPAVGIKPCGGCKKRQEALNRIVPFKRAD